MGAQILASVAPEYAAFEMPYLWRDQQHLRSVWDGPIGQEITDAILERKGIRIIAVLNRGARNLTVNRPVYSPEDVQGLKIRTTQNAVHIAAWEAIGAVPTPMPFGEVFMALRQGIIDGQENPVDLIHSASFYEVQDFLVLTEHVRSIAWLGLSEAWFQTLPSEHQQIILEEAEKAARYNDELLEREEGSIMEKLADRMTVIEPEEIDHQAFRERVMEVPEQFSAVWKPGLHQAIVDAR
jgi:TRAP-type transport system periplasmic protein